MFSSATALFNHIKRNDLHADHCTKVPLCKYADVCEKGEGDSVDRRYLLQEFENSFKKSGMSSSTESDDKAVHFYTNCIIHILFEYVMVEHDEYEKTNGLKNAIATHVYEDSDQWSEYKVKSFQMSKLPERSTSKSEVSTDRQNMIELFYRFGNLFHLRAQWAMTRLMCTPDFFPKSLSSHGGLLIKELSSKQSGSVTHEVARYGGSDPKQYFLPN